MKRILQEMQYYLLLLLIVRRCIHYQLIKWHYIEKKKLIYDWQWIEEEVRKCDHSYFQKINDDI